MSVRSFHPKFTRRSHVSTSRNSFLYSISIYSNISTNTIPFQPVEKFTSYGRTRSSQRSFRSSKIPSPSKDIDENPRPSKKAKKRNSSRQFDIYEDIDIEVDNRNTRESSILSISPKKPRITIEIPQRRPFQEIDPNIARPNDHYLTIARLPDRIVSLSSLRKW